MVRTMSEPAAKVHRSKTAMYRTLVLDAAEHLFAEHGYEKTKIQDIAAASGLSLGTVYSVFGGKAAIIDAVHDTRLQELFALTGRAMKSDVPAVGRLLQGNRTFVHWLAARHDYLRIHLDRAVSWSSTPSTETEELEHAWHRGIELMARVISEAMRDGDLWPGDALLIARLMTATQQVFISAWVEAGMKEDPDSLTRRIEVQLRRSFFRGDA